VGTVLRAGLFLLVLQLALPLAGSGVEFETPIDETWLSPAPELQLYKEGLDDRKGMGRIFVPAMTNPANEPPYAVFRGDDVIGEKPMGSSFFVEPGHYTVVLGSGNLEQRLHYEVDVLREQTLILEPVWASLTVDVINEVRSSVQLALTIFDAVSGENIGVIPAVNTDLGEKLQTLVLKPGLYKIVERGLDFNTYIRFATTQLEAGIYKPYTIVINSATHDFTGAGIISRATQLRQLKAWKVYGAVTGNAVLTTNNESRETRTDISFISQFENRLLFDHFPHYYLSSNLLDLGAIKQHNIRWVINQDGLRLKNTYVYYILQWLGGYGRLQVDTHLLPRIKAFSTPLSVTMRNQAGTDSIRKVGVDRIQVAPAFYPLTLQEGIGIDVTPLKRYNARLSFRVGFGSEQVWNSDVYKVINDSLFQLNANARKFGVESSVVSNLAFFQNTTVTTEIALLFPLQGDKRSTRRLTNIVNLGVSKYISLDHTLHVTKDPAVQDYTVIDQRISVRLSYFLF